MLYSYMHLGKLRKMETQNPWLPVSPFQQWHMTVTQQFTCCATWTHGPSSTQNSSQKSECSLNTSISRSVRRSLFLSTAVHNNHIMIIHKAEEGIFYWGVTVKMMQQPLFQPVGSSRFNITVATNWVPLQVWFGLVRQLMVSESRVWIQKLYVRLTLW